MILLGQFSPIAFKIGEWPVRWYGVIIGFGILIAYILIGRESKKKQLDSERVSDLIFWAIIFGFLGARLYYVLFRLDYYLAHPTQILSIWEGGIAIYGGILAGIATIYVLSKKYALPFIKLLDIFAPAVMIAQAIGRWGNFMNQEAHGEVVSRTFLEQLFLPNWLIEQMKINGVYYQPTFLYESLWNVVGFSILLFARRKKSLLKEGEVVAGYLLWYGLGRLVIEGMRTDSLYLGPLRVSQWLAGIFVVASVLFIIVRRTKYQVIDYTADRL